MRRRERVLETWRLRFGGFVRWRRFKVCTAWIASMLRIRPFTRGPRWDLGPAPHWMVVEVEGEGEAAEGGLRGLRKLRFWWRSENAMGGTEEGE